jgi:hypothetical protein
VEFGCAWGIVDVINNQAAAAAPPLDLLASQLAPRASETVDINTRLAISGLKAPLLIERVSGCSVGEFVARETARRHTDIVLEGRDVIVGVIQRYRMGFLRPSEDVPLGPSDGVFGYPGQGGQLAVGDLDRVPASLSCGTSLRHGTASPRVVGNSTSQAAYSGTCSVLPFSGTAGRSVRVAARCDGSRRRVCSLTRMVSLVCRVADSTRAATLTTSPITLKS